MKTNIEVYNVTSKADEFRVVIGNDSTMSRIAAVMSDSDILDVLLSDFNSESFNTFVVFMNDLVKGQYMQLREAKGDHFFHTI